MKEVANLRADKADLDKRLGQKQLLKNISDRPFDTKKIKLFNKNTYPIRAII
jgi:hypothetical protein